MDVPAYRGREILNAVYRSSIAIAGNNDLRSCVPDLFLKGVDHSTAVSYIQFRRQVYTFSLACVKLYFMTLLLLTKTKRCLYRVRE